MTDDPTPREHLLRLLTVSGISNTAYARALGSDRTRVDDWLSGTIQIPQTAQDWLKHAIADEDSIHTRVGEIEITIRRTGPRKGRR